MSRRRGHITAHPSIACRTVQGPVEFPVAKHGAHVVPGLLIRDQFEKLVGVAGSVAGEPAPRRRKL